MNVIIYRETEAALLDVGDRVLVGLSTDTDHPAKRLPVVHAVTELRYVLDGVEAYVRPVGRVDGKRQVLRLAKRATVPVECTPEQQRDCWEALQSWGSDEGYLIALGPDVELSTVREVPADA